MMMKYFRFLYGETGGCLTHLGEIRDTKTAEHFTFLYLKGLNGHVNQTETEHALFLCPKSLDLLVLENADERVVEEMRRLLKDTRVDTLVCCADAGAVDPESLPDVKRMVCLTDDVGKDQEKTSRYESAAAGWRLSVRCCGKTSLMLMHGLADMENTCSNGSDAEPHRDCVMNVKLVSENKKCHLEREPDGYGCALGCCLHEDYDVCGAQRNGASDYVTGTVLLPEECDEATDEAFVEELKRELPKIRFVGLPGKSSGAILNAALGEEVPGTDVHRRYYIGNGEELSDERIAAVSRSNMRHAPFILEPGRALCCSGFYKY